MVSPLLTIAMGLRDSTQYTHNASGSIHALKEATTYMLRNALDFAEMCSLFGYGYEEHVVTTPDGYLLVLHRILPGDYTLNPKPVVLFQHGLLTNSEFFIALSDTHRCLPFVLVDNGYDIWLGNNRYGFISDMRIFPLDDSTTRGNKYSQKHTSLPTSSPAFWDFSLDELAKYDMPSFVSYILTHTNQPNLSYIGFSQGSAQAFAALSSNKELNSKLNVFIALAPIIQPRGYASTILDLIAKKK